jgi:hypothetical protein
MNAGLTTYVSTALLASAAAIAQAQTLAMTPLPDAALEDSFWECDARSAREMLNFTDGVHCAMLLDELKRRRFGDDATQFLQWWRTHKTEQHARHAGVAATSADDDLPPEP